MEHPIPKKPKFSIVLPTYNRAAWLNGAIDSVLQQSFSDWELIVVDDGSTDHTRDLVAGYADPRIRYHYQENAERSTARNKGMQLARGRFICFLDSDDRYRADHLTQLDDGIRRNGEKLFVSGAGIVDENGMAQGQKGLEQRPLAVETILFNAIGTSQIGLPARCSDVLRFDPALRINEDTDFMVRATAVLDLVVLPQPTVLYTVHSDNSVALGGEHNVYAERMHSLKKLLQLEACRGLSHAQKTQLLSNCYFGMAKHHVLRHEFQKARWTMFQAALRFPNSRLKEKLYAVMFPGSMVPQNTFSA